MRFLLIIIHVTVPCSELTLSPGITLEFVSCHVVERLSNHVVYEKVELLQIVVASFSVLLKTTASR